MIPIFDDGFSYIHPLLGFVSKSTPVLGTLVMLGFVGYQLFEKEPLANKIGDFFEFGAGYVVAALVEK